MEKKKPQPGVVYMPAPDTKEAVTLTFRYRVEGTNEFIEVTATGNSAMACAAEAQKMAKQGASIWYPGKTLTRIK